MDGDRMPSPVPPLRKHAGRPDSVRMETTARPHGRNDTVLRLRYQCHPIRFARDEFPPMPDILARRGVSSRPHGQAFSDALSPRYFGRPRLA